MLSTNINYLERGHVKSQIRLNQSQVNKKIIQTNEEAESLRGSSHSILGLCNKKLALLELKTTTTVLVLILQSNQKQI